MPISQLGFARAKEEPKVVDIKLNSSLGGTLNQLDVDESGTIAVVSSSGRVATVWELDAKRRVVLRIPQREEQPSGRYSVAVSPDGRWVVLTAPPLDAGGGKYVTSSARIYVFDRAEQVLVKTIEGDVPTQITRLRFSPDGQFLAASLSDGCGLRVWQTKTWLKIYADDAGYAGDYPHESCSATEPRKQEEGLNVLPDTVDLRFGPPGSDIWLVTSSETGVRAYRRTAAGATRVAELAPKDLQLGRPAHLSFNRDGSKLAIGDSLDLRVSVIDVSRWASGATLLELSKVLSEKGASEARSGRRFLSALIWTGAGQQEWLNAAGFLPSDSLRPEVATVQGFTAQYDNNIVSWKAEDLSLQPQVLSVAQNTIRDFASLANANAILAATEGEVIQLGLAAGRPSEDTQRIIGGNEMDFRNVLPFRISADAHQLFATGYWKENSPLLTSLRLNLETLTLTPVESENTDELEAALKNPENAALVPPTTKAVKYWKRQRLNIALPQFFGKEPEGKDIDRDEISRSVAQFRAGDKDYVLWGTSRFLRIVSDSAEILCELPVPADAYRTNVSADGTIAVVGLGDGTVRWYRINTDDHNRCLTLLFTAYFQQQSDQEWRWAIWRPDGYFVYKGGAADMACWHVDYPAGSVCEDLGKYQPVYYRGDKILEALRSGAEKGPDPNLELELKQAQPRYKVTLVDPPAQNLEGPGWELELTFNIEPLVKMDWPQLLIAESQGRLFEKNFEGQVYEKEKPIVLHSAGTYKISVTLPQSIRATKEEFELCLNLVEAKEGEDTATTDYARVPMAGACPRFKWGGALATPDRKLRAVLIGFSDAVATTPLKYAHDDALDFAKLLLTDFQKQRNRNDKVDPDFSDISIDVFVAPPGSAKNTDSVFEDQKVKELQKNGDKVKIHPLTLRDDATETSIYVNELVKRTLDYIINEDTSDDVFLFFFAGHGYEVTSDDGRQMTDTLLVTPFSNVGSGDGMSMSQIASQIASIEGLKIIMIDACRTSDSNPKPNERRFDIDRVNTALNSDATQGSHVFFSVGPGQVSYEQGRYSVSDFLPLWPDDVLKNRPRGNGVFSLGASLFLMCREGDYPKDNKIGPREFNTFFEAVYLSDRYSVLKEIRQDIEKVSGIELEDIKLLYPDWRTIKASNDFTMRRFLPDDKTCFDKFISQ